MKAESLTCAIIMSLCVMLGLVTPGMSQTLETINKSLEKKPGMVTPPPPECPPAPHSTDSCLLDPVSDAACYAGGVALFYGGIVSWERATGDIPEPETGEPECTARMVGEPLIPLLRLDGQWVRTDGDISVLDSRLEAGFGPLAVDVRSSVFDEDASEVDLTETRWHLLYRMSFSDQLEVDLGIGGVEVDSESTQNAYSFTAPVRFYFNRHVGLELWPAWSEVNGMRVDDYEASLMLNLGWVSVKPGYRVWNFGSESLEGPAVGISFHW